MAYPQMLRFPSFLPFSPGFSSATPPPQKKRSLTSPLSHHIMESPASPPQARVSHLHLHRGGAIKAEKVCRFVFLGARWV